jgi:copper chaperone CopZ
MKLWDYDNDSLVTLCDKCHKEIHTDLKKIAGIIAFNIFIGEIDILDLLPLSEFRNVFQEKNNITK